MTFIFWQNIISIHQKAFLEALAEQPGVNKVILAVAHELTPVRREMGWYTPRPAGVEIVMSPDDGAVRRLVETNTGAIHVMGGIRIGRMITTAFDACVRHKCRIGVMTEPYDTAGAKGLMRTLKYRYYAFRYFRHIQFVLAIGRQGVKQYAALGYDAQRLFGWAYFITLGPPAQSRNAGDDGVVKIIYAGRLEEAKGICRFVKELVNAGDRNFKLDIYGSGTDAEQIRRLAAEAGLAEQITITRFLKYNELLAKYTSYDWVVLPSAQKDGWGVIVSEGLLNGLKAICSNICGASWVIKDGFNGVVFDWKTPDAPGKEHRTGERAALKSCKTAISEMLSGTAYAGREAISGWANRAISGAAGAGYFMKIVDCVYNNGAKPGVPWLSNGD